jgi:DNA-binding response OmpR family regulator
MSSTSLKVFIVEDNSQMAEMTKDHIIEKFPNAQISIFNTGEDALKETSSPDIIVLDYQLDTQNPRALNGIQVLGKMKKQFSAPVIFLSAQEKPEVSAHCIKYGAYDYVVKNREAFHRLEVIISNILTSKKQKPQGGSQKTLITVLVGIIVVLVVIILAMMKK